MFATFPSRSFLEAIHQTWQAANAEKVTRRTGIGWDSHAVYTQEKTPFCKSTTFTKRCALKRTRARLSRSVSCPDGMIRRKVLGTRIRRARAAHGGLLRSFCLIQLQLRMLKLDEAGRPLGREFQSPGVGSRPRGRHARLAECRRVTPLDIAVGMHACGSGEIAD